MEKNSQRNLRIFQGSESHTISNAILGLSALTLYDAIITSRQVSYATQRVQVSWSEVHARVSEPYPDYTKNQLKDRANTMRRGRHLMNWDVIRSDD